MIGGGIVILLVLQNQDGIAKESAAQLKWIGSKITGPVPEAPAKEPPAASSCRRSGASASPPKVLEVRELTVRYGGVTAVDVAVADRATRARSPG